MKILRKSKKTKTKKPHKNKDFQQIYQEIANFAPINHIVAPHLWNCPPPVMPPMTYIMTQLADVMEITHIFRVLSCYFQLHINLNLTK